MLVHKHLLVKAEVDKPIVDVERAREWLSDLVEEIGMSITEHGGPHVDYVNKEGNCGIAGIVMIETSHISIHIWDQLVQPIVQMDVYSCKNFDHQLPILFLTEMEPKNVIWKCIDRDNFYHIDGDVPGAFSMKVYDRI